MFNLFLYGGISLIILGLIFFVISQFKLRGIENEIDRQKKLHQSFMKAKQNDKNNFNYKHTIIK